MTKTKLVPYAQDIDVDIDIHRAPTDESVALLNEMQDKAKANILTAFKIDSNDLRATGIAYQDDVFNEMIVCYAKFILNGQEYHITTKYDKRQFEQKLHDVAVGGYYGFRKHMEEQMIAWIKEEYIKVLSDMLCKQLKNYIVPYERIKQI